MASVEVVAFAELLQHPTRTAARLSVVRAVHLRRRDADDLVLMTADRAEQEGKVIDLTARLLARLVARDPSLIREVLPDVLPWSRFLPSNDVDQLVAEFISTAEAASAVGNMTPVSQLLIEWQHTAEVYADPELYEALTSRTFGDFGRVPKPEAA